MRLDNMPLSRNVELAECHPDFSFCFLQSVPVESVQAVMPSAPLVSDEFAILFCLAAIAVFLAMAIAGHVWESGRTARAIRKHRNERHKRRTARAARRYS
jgi:hypothetical protein